VANLNRSPSEGIEILLYDAEGRVNGRTVAEPGGDYTFSGLAAGTYVAVARANPSATLPTESESPKGDLIAVGRLAVDSAGSGEAADLLPASGAVIVGRVTETTSGEPVPRTPVSAYRPTDGGWVATALSWDDGTYFLVVPQGTYVLDARRPAGKLYGASTYNGLEGTVSQGGNLAAATRVAVAGNQIVFGKDFQIPLGTITVVSPNGGETWTAGAQATVSWTTTAVPAEMQILALIRDGIDGPGAAVFGQTSERQFTVTFPVPTWLGDGGDYVLELWLFGSDGFSILATDQSDGSFTITGSSSRRRIELLSPSVGQSCWMAGSEQTISWIPAELGCLQAVLLDGNQMRAMVGYIDASAGALSWSVPFNVGDGSNYRVLCVAGQPQGFDVFAVSPTFEICGSAGRPLFRNILPYAGQTWTAGAVENTCWESDDPTGYVVSMLVQSGSPLGGYFMTGTPAVQGCSDDPICSGLPESDEYRVVSRLQTVQGLLLSDESAGDFRITGGKDLMLRLTSPNGREVFTAGQPWSITWEPLDAGGREVDISLYTASGEIATYSYVGHAPASAGRFDSTVCPYLEPGEYVIELHLAYQYGCPIVEDQSDQPFTIAGGQASTLTLTSFDHGGEYTSGQTYPITWDAQNAAGRTVHVRVYRQASECMGWIFHQDLGAAPAEEGHLDWNLCPYLEAADDYGIEIWMSDPGCPTVYAESDQAFTIAGGVPVPSLELTWPMGGEALVAGQMHTITWNPINAGGSMVNLDLHRSDQHIQHLGQVPAADGSFEWTLCEYLEPATDYVLVIGIYTDSCPGIQDRSEPFSIAGGKPLPHLELTAPSGGESWAVGTQQTISWNSNASEGLVHIQLYRAGESYAGVQSLPVTDGQFSWQVGPAELPPGTDYTIHIQYDHPACRHLGISDDSPAFEINRASISGTVTDSAGAPLGGILVELLALPPGGGTYTIAYAVTAYGSGEYTMAVPPGQYRLRAGGELEQWAFGPAVHEPVGQHWYERVNFSWPGYAGSQALCQSRGGYLASISSAQENEWLWNQLAGGWCMLGATDAGHEGAWTWASGEPWQYTNWRSGEPNDCCLGQDYLAMGDPGGQWDDAHFFAGPFICEYAQPPTVAENYARIYYPDRFYFHDAEIIIVPEAAHLVGKDFVLPAGGTLSGTVTESDGVTPIAGAWVSAWPCQWWGGGEPSFNVETDSHGQYAIRHLPTPATYQMWVSTATHVGKCYNNSNPWEGCTCVEVLTQQEVCGVDYTLELGGCISGTVRINGVPVEGVRANAGARTRGMGRSEVTDPGGNYTICGLPADDYSVSVEPYDPDPPGPPFYGFEFYDDVISACDSEAVPLASAGLVAGIDFDLNEGGCIQGTVFDEDTGEPLSGNTIGLEVWDGGPAPCTSLWLTTDAFGRFTAIARPGSYLVFAERPGYQREYYNGAFDPSLAWPIALVAGWCAHDINIYLNPTHRIGGQVQSRESQQVIAGATCYALPLPPQMGLGGGDATDGSGDFLIEGLPDHDYQLTCSAEGYCPHTQMITIQGHDLLGLVIELDRSARMDFDDDCDVDLNDYGIFQSCASGPAIPYFDVPVCQAADLDEDGDVDQSDFGAFQRCYSGMGNDADPDCGS
jgi:hypothetical protein